MAALGGSYPRAPLAGVVCVQSRRRQSALVAGLRFMLPLPSLEQIGAIDETGALRHPAAPSMARRAGCAAANGALQATTDWVMPWSDANKRLRACSPHDRGSDTLGKENLPVLGFAAAIAQRWPNSVGWPGELCPASNS